MTLCDPIYYSFQLNPWLYNIFSLYSLGFCQHKWQKLNYYFARHYISSWITLCSLTFWPAGLWVCIGWKLGERSWGRFWGRSVTCKAGVSGRLLQVPLLLNQGWNYYFNYSAIFPIIESRQNFIIFYSCADQLRCTERKIVEKTHSNLKKL
jgi:hypothetical protein